MDNLLVDFLITLSLIAVDGVLAAARSSFVSAKRTKLDQMIEENVDGASLARRVAEDSTRLILTIRLAQTLCRFLAAGVATLIFAPLLAQLLSSVPLIPGLTMAIAVVIITGSVAVFVVVWVEMVPESLVLRDAEGWAIRFAPMIAALESFFSPLVRLSVFASGLVTVPLGGRAPQIVTEEEIKTMVDAGEEGGVIEEEEKEMIYSIFQFRDTPAREVMVPRIDVFALDAETPFEEAINEVVAAGHSRIPVYSETIDNIVGLIYAKDLLRVWREGATNKTLRDLLRPAHFIPEAKALDELLAELQQQRIHMAVVVDEYGGTAGLVTLEDIVEEIVGEIRDEYDTTEESPYQKINDDEYIFDGGININDVNELLDLKLPSDDADTIGGYVYGQLGRVPASGDQLTEDNVVMEVQHVTGRRIRKVRVRKLPPAPKEEDEDQTDER
ncbi:MAG: HlyC/CorC family transporter [Chloroflexi bacterium]|nr:HlyC/CorC family transporter [Chloroflexota bacterium]